MLNQKENILFPYSTNREMEPYSVIRRSADTPIFHPYYINYGYNKVELISRLTILSNFQYLLFIRI